VKILLIHPGVDFAVADVFTGWWEALTDLGCTVRTFNLHDRIAFYAGAGRLTTDGDFVKLLDDDGAVILASKGLHASVLEYQPDVVIVVSCFFIPLDTLDLLRARGAKVVIVHLESPYEDDRQLIRAAHADLNVINDPTNLAEFRMVAPTVFMGAAHRPSIHHPGPATPDMVSQFCFVGTGFPSRIRFLEAVDFTDIDVALGGMWQHLDTDSPLRKFLAHDIDQCMDNTATVDAYRSTLMSANLYRRETADGHLPPAPIAGWAMSPREVELAAVGCFFARDRRAEGDQVLHMLPTFETPAELGDLIRYYLFHDDLRRLLADKARGAVAGRTFHTHAGTLLSMLNG
jgi:spore maturation protein CgeB